MDYKVYDEVKFLSELLMKYKDKVAISTSDGIFHIGRVIFGTQEATVLIIGESLKEKTIS